MPFEVVDVYDWPVASEEPLGSKAKDWLRRPRLATEEDELWLWKALTRETAGDDWAEKVAEQLAALLDIPHATVELARRGTQRGVICRDFRYGTGSFVPGNELLWQADPSYPKSKRRWVAEHTVGRVLDRLDGLEVLAPPGEAHWIPDAAKVFVGYLMFDAWIGNQDRHHENWGVIVWNRLKAATTGAVGLETPVQVWMAPTLAPSFDHAASLGQYETDRRRELRLGTKDRAARLEAWAAKATSHMYASNAPPRQLTTFEAFDAAAAQDSEAGSAWLDRLEKVEWQRVVDIVAAVPESLLSPLARRFALRLLEFDRNQLLTRHRP